MTTPPKSRKRALLWGAASVSVAILFLVLGSRTPNTPEGLYKAWQKPMIMYGYVCWMEQHLPSPLSSGLRLRSLENYLIDKDTKIEEQLAAFGYTTNLHIPFPNAQPHRTSIQSALRDATASSGTKWAFIIVSNATVVIICRTNDASNLATIVEKVATAQK